MCYKEIKMTGKTWVKKRKECDAEYKELTHINN